MKSTRLLRLPWQRVHFASCRSDISMPVLCLKNRTFPAIVFAFVVTVLALFMWEKGKPALITKSNLVKPRNTSQVPQHVTTPKCSCGPIPTEAVLRTFPHKEIAQIYHNYVNSIQISCTTTAREGNKGDGGWDVCLDPPYKPTSPCLVYSFGISNDWTFDDAITSHYGCELHAYDPTIKLEDHDRKTNLHFHHTGLGSEDKTNDRGWKMRTFNSLKKENGHPEAMVDVLKMDIEHSEWEAIPQMLASGAFDKVKQFCFELHVKLKPQPEPSPDKYIRGLRMLRDLYDAGFRIFKTNKNMDAKYNSMFGPLRTGCHEIYMIKNNTRTFG